MAGDLIHGPELDVAIGAAGAPEEMGICLTALDSRVTAMIEGQLEENLSDAGLDRARKALLDAGAPFDAGTVNYLAMRTAIGGAYTFGIAVGQELERRRR